MREIAQPVRNPSTGSSVRPGRHDAGNFVRVFGEDFFSTSESL
jgi:hypothetical protein